MRVEAQPSPLRALALALIAGLAACGGGAESNHPPPVGASAETPTHTGSSSNVAAGSTQTAQALLASELRFSGELEARLRPAPGGAKLLDAEGNELARYHLREDGSVRVRDAADVALGRVKGASDKLKVTGPEGEPLLGIYQLQSDGDWKYEDANESLLLRVGVREYGHKIEDANDELLGKTRERGSRVVFEDAGGVERFATEDALSTAALACLAFEELSIPLRVGLLLRVHHDHGE